jgi:hypothetical protein
MFLLLEAWNITLEQTQQTSTGVGVNSPITPLVSEPHKYNGTCLNLHSALQELTA